MRSLFKLIIFMVFFGASLKAQEGWFWQNPKPQGNHLIGVFVFDQNTAIAVGQLGTVIKTNDGGMNWSVLHNVGGTVRTLLSVYFIDSSTGWAVGEEGVILKTTDGGAEWISQTSRTSNNLNSVYFTDVSTGWTVGRSGKILKTTTGGVVTSVEDVHHSETLTPQEVALFNNYPNPFNSSTTIRFKLPKSGFVTLKVYNLLGEEIETLISGQKSAGEHQVKWNAEGLSTGIYFYRLQAGESTETKKLILQK
jgi:photosystem II stability/assembly factor-like uncharacterized protein